MNPSLTDFLNHGLLPFIGREEATGRIMEFWRETPNSHGLRAMLMIGEAGIGKSRLIAESTPRVTEANGAVVVVKLFSGGATSLAPLLAKGIWGSDSGRRLLKREPEGSLASVSESLCRLGRLRPLLVVIEDIHLLSGEPLRDFARLLEILSEEMISLLCVARPLEEGVRGVMERFITHELNISGLDAGSVAELWKSLFLVPPDDATLVAFERVTLGNPLAVRSALRGATSSGALAEDTDTGEWRITLPLSTFVAGVERHVRLLIEGMAAHLTEAEKIAARSLASLGEVFSLEGARALLDDSDAIIEGLAYKGMITTSGTTRPPLSGLPSAYPLMSFTHTLIYNQLAHGAAVGMESVLRVIARDLPIYSIVPYELLCRHGARLHSSSDIVAEAVQRTLAAVELLDITPDWILGKVIAEAAMILTESASSEGLNPYELRELRAAAIRVRLTTLRRENHTPRFAHLAQRLEQIVDDPPTEELAMGKLDALRFGIWINAEAPSFEVWDEVEELTHRFPRLIVSEAYILLLRDVASLEQTHTSPERRRRVERQLEEALASEYATDEFARFAVNQVAIHFLMAFDTEAELDRRLALLTEMELTAQGKQKLLLQAVKVPFLEDIGHIREMLQAVELQLPLLQKLGFKHTWPGLKAMKLSAEVALGGDLDKAAEDARRLVANSPVEVVARVRWTLGERLELIALLRNEPLWARNFSAEFPGVSPTAWMRTMAGALLENNLDGALHHAKEATDLNPAFASVVELLSHDNGVEPTEALQRFRAILATPLLHLNDLLVLRVALDLTVIATRNDPRLTALGGELQDDVCEAIRRGLVWCSSRRLDCYVASLVARYAEELPTAEGDYWRHLVVGKGVDGASQEASDTDRDHTRVTMLGTIVVHRPDGAMVKLRTGRLRPLLGLLVADRMLDTPLSHREFCQLVSGIDGDHERARKATNLAVFRLREVLGHDAIITDGETPQLNTGRVDADILDVHGHLKEAGKFVRHGPLMSARLAVMAAFDILGGEVPFPGLYEEFFEALREDLDYRLRTTVLRVATRLLDEGDAEGAEGLLQRGFDAMPDDEEISELLRESLRGLGRNTDAERVRMRVED